MSSIDQLVNSNVLGDEELAKVWKDLQANPSQLQLFLQGQQNMVFKDIVKQKDASLDKVYGELKRTVESQQSTMTLDKRNKDLLAIQEELYQVQQGKDGNLEGDKQLAERKFEMNEWSVQNKKETLYVYSLLFVLLSLLIFLTVLWRMGIISSSLCGSLMLPFILFFLFVWMYRSKYTNVFRDKRYWNRRSFQDGTGLIPLPSICPDGSIVPTESTTVSTPSTTATATTATTPTEPSTASNAPTASTTSCPSDCPSCC